MGLLSWSLIVNLSCNFKVWSLMSFSCCCKIGYCIAFDFFLWFFWDLRDRKEEVSVCYLLAFTTQIKLHYFPYFSDSEGGHIYTSVDGLQTLRFSTENLNCFFVSMINSFHCYCLLIHFGLGVDCRFGRGICCEVIGSNLFETFILIGFCFRSIVICWF